MTGVVVLVRVTLFVTRPTRTDGNPDARRITDDLKELTICHSIRS